MAGRLRRYIQCGKVFGPICCCVAAVDWLYWRLLEVVKPARLIPTAPAFPNPFCTQLAAEPPSQIPLPHAQKETASL